ncbi:Salutaridine reductase [Cardamine amara subsp. amara]|uniref:Salutaridine reductase n=1 Tax=Cardamine amara subsp. amara TaxID=228776 RepID=A0ABD1CAA1_CARAN
MDHLIAPFSPINRWWSEETTAVVTGANKGIGFAVVKRLLELGLTVVLTARNTENGNQAADSLRRIGFQNIHFCCLDISDPYSIAAFASWLRRNFGVLDILVNNAAVSFNAVGENYIKDPETIIKTNFHGAKLLTETLLPLFRRSVSASRILNISSRLGTLNKLRRPSIRQILENDDLTNEQIDATVTQFLEDVKSGTWEKQGWPENWPDYAISKMALNAYSRVLARLYDGKKLSVNCLCPGFTRTSMTGGQGTHTADEAAATVAKLVLLPPENLTSGKFYICLEPKKIISRL